MKSFSIVKNTLLILASVFSLSANAQLYISGGAVLHLSNDAVLTSAQGDVVLNNNISGAGTGKLVLKSTILQNLTSNGNKVFGLEIDNTANVVMSHNLEVDGNLTLTNGALVLNDKNLTLNGNATSTLGTLAASYLSNLNVNGSLITIGFSANYNNLKNLTIGNGTVCNLTSNLSLAAGLNFGTLTMGNSAALNILQGKLLVFKSDVNGTARIASIGTGAVLNAGTTGYGEVQAERFIPAKRTFRFLSPMVTTTHSNATKPSITSNWQESKTATANLGTHITGSTSGNNGFDATITGNGSLFTFNAAAQNWVEWKESTHNISTAAFQNFGEGYRVLIRGDRTINLNAANPTATNTVLRTTGKPLIGSLQLTSLTTPALGANVNDYTLIGNPYLSAINWDDLYTASSNIQDYYWIWDPTRNTRGAWIYWDKSDGANSGLGSSVNQYIQQGQAFIVQTGAANPVVNFNENIKAISNNNVFKTNNTASKLSITLTNNTLLAQNNGMDVANVLFDDSYSNAINADDIVKMQNQDENLSVNVDATDLAKEAHANVAVNDTVKLRIWQMKNADYVLKIEAQNFSSGVEAWLKDNFANTTTPINLSGNTNIAFTTNASSPLSINQNRFSIVFKNNTALPVSGLVLKANQQNNAIQIDYTVATETNMDRYEIEKSNTGANFSKAATQNATGNNGLFNTYKWLDNQANIGNNFYRIKAISKDGKMQFSNIVNVKLGNLKSNINIVPNPIVNKLMNVQFENAEKGNYLLLVTNELGQKIITKEISHSGGSATLQIQLPSTISQGTYFVKITSNNKEQQLKILVE